MENCEEESVILTDKQRARIERNRQRAVLLRNARLASHPYMSKTSNPTTENSQRNSTRVVDSGGGFLIDPEDNVVANEKQQKRVFEPGVVLTADQVCCEECDKPFLHSYLYNHFSVLVCDGCRDDAEKHKLITKTDAKTQFLLKDCDFDRREPPLKCIVKKNPHRSHWGEMKLYLRTQVEQRALEIWKTEEAIEEEKEKRALAKDQKKQKKFDKKVKELRRAVRTSTWKRDLSQHVHDFPAAGEAGGEVYDESTDTWCKTCKTCGHKVTYEKM